MRIGIGVLAALLVVVILRLRFCYDVSLPPKPPRPDVSETVASAKDITEAVEASVEGYAAFLAEDSKRYRIDPPATPETMARKFPYALDETTRELVPGTAKSTLETAGLRLTASARGTGHSKILTLRIDNLTDRPVAYNVVTRPERGQRACHSKSTLPHNALVLEPANDAVHHGAEDLRWRLGHQVDVQLIGSLGPLAVLPVRPDVIHCHVQRTVTPPIRRDPMYSAI